MCLVDDANDRTAALIRDNWQRVRAHVAEVAEQVGRAPESVKIIGVSKYVGPKLTLQLAQAGCSHLGENRPQALWQKAQWNTEARADSWVQWHMIGHLQRNKIRRTLPLIARLHSLDSLRLAQAMQAEGSKLERPLPVLLELNVTRDESKTGMGISAVRELLDRAGDLDSITIDGFMAMSTHQASAAEARREFCRVREARDQFAQEYPNLDLRELSMGMSGDYREAIMEGATMVRVGTSLWKGVLPG